MDEKRELSEMTRLKQEAKYLRGRIKKAEALIRRRNLVANLRKRLETLRLAAI